MAERGFFVVLEGIDGSGKTEQTRRLAAWLRSRGRDVAETREPTDGLWGRRFRAWARGEHEADSDEVLRYFIEDRREHVEKTIAPALRAGAVVVCDRYVDSTLAYQAAQGLDRDRVRTRLEAESFPVPDHVLWLRVSVDRALARLGPRAVERFEDRTFLERVDHEYERLGLDPIPADGSPDEVCQELKRRLAPLL